MYEDNPLDGLHPRRFPAFSRKRSSVKVPIRPIVPNLFFRYNERFEFRLFDRLRRLHITATSRLDFLKDLVISEPFKRGVHSSLLSFVAKLLDVLNFGKEFPYGIDWLFHLFLPIGQRDDAHDLREIGIAGGADQQTANVATGFFRIWAQPWPCTIAASKRPVLHDGSLRHAFLQLALAPYVYLSKIAACSAFINPQPAPAICLGAVNKGIPINVSNVTGTTSSDETNRHNWTPFLIGIDKFATG